MPFVIMIIKLSPLVSELSGSTSLITAQRMPSGSIVVKSKQTNINPKSLNSPNRAFFSQLRGQYKLNTIGSLNAYNFYKPQQLSVFDYYRQFNQLRFNCGLPFLNNAIIVYPVYPLPVPGLDVSSTTIQLILSAPLQFTVRHFCLYFLDYNKLARIYPLSTNSVYNLTNWWLVNIGAIPPVGTSIRVRFIVFYLTRPYIQSDLIYNLITY